MSFRELSHLVLCLPRLLVPSTFPSITSFSIPLARIVCPKAIGARLMIMPSRDVSVLISSKIDVFVLISVQGILSNLREHHNSKASVFFLSLFLIVQLSQTYISTGELMLSLADPSWVPISLCLS